MKKKTCHSKRTSVIVKYSFVKKISQAIRLLLYGIFLLCTSLSTKKTIRHMAHTSSSLWALKIKIALLDLFDLVSFLVFVTGVVLFIRFFVFNPYTVVGQSMEPVFHE